MFRTRYHDSGILALTLASVIMSIPFYVLMGNISNSLREIADKMEPSLT